MEIPIYRLDLTQGFDAPEVALVEAPAIQEDFFAFSEDISFNFAVKKDQMELVGPVMIPYKKIDRTFGQVYFTEEDINAYLDSYMKSGSKLNLFHTKETIDQYVKEIWQVEDPKTDKTVALGMGQYPKGTIIQRVKINDEKFWNEQIKTGIVKGFSIQFKNPKITMATEEDKSLMFSDEEIELRRLEETVKEYLDRTHNFAVDANKVRAAMSTKRVVSIYYTGDEDVKPGWRDIEIFCYGQSLAGNPAIRAWIRTGSTSLSGGTKKSENQGWRMFLLRKITSWVEAKTRYTGLRPGYNKNDLGMSVIYNAL